MTSADVAAASAFWTTAVRAREAGRADRLFTDPWAAALAGERGRELLRRKEERDGREDVLLPLRTRWFDDAVTAAMATGADQLVELGSGLDTRPYRLALAPGTRTFELDQPSVLQHKQAVLQAGPPAGHGVTDVPTDLTGEWADDLRGAGFDPSRRTVWVAEGLLMYVDHEAATRLLSHAARLSAPGSVLLLDTLARTAPVSVGNRFVPEDLPSLLDALGWTEREHTTITEPARAYGRLPDPPKSGDTPAGYTYLLAVADRLEHALRRAPRC